MTHKYRLGCWLRFYKNSQLIIAVVEYLPKREAWEKDMKYFTDHGEVFEKEVLECRYP